MAHRCSPVVLIALLCFLPEAFAQQALWLPPGTDQALTTGATLHNDFTFDKSMLGIAANMLQDDQAKQAVAKLRSVTVDVFKYPQADTYNPQVLQSIRAQYDGEGLKHVVSSHVNAETGEPGRADVWVRMQQGNIEGAVVLLVQPKSIEIVAVDGRIDPMDLLHLRGHFGIPRFPDQQINP